MVGEIFGVDGVIVLAVVLVVLFGGSQIPRFARSLGSAHKEFKAGLDDPAPTTTTEVVEHPTTTTEVVQRGTTQP